MCWVITNVKKSTFFCYLQTWSEETFYHLIEVFHLCVLLFEFQPGVLDNCLFNTSDKDSKVISNTDIFSTTTPSETYFDSFDFQSDYCNNVNLCSDCFRNNNLQNTVFSNISKSFNGNEQDMSNFSNFEYYKKTQFFPHCIKCAKKLFIYKNGHSLVCWRSNEQLLSTSFEKKHPVKSIHKPI